MAEKETSTYLKENRKKLLIRSVFLFSVSFIYICFVIAFQGVDETFKWLLIFIPLNIGIEFFDIFQSKLQSFWKGIRGENKVKDILDNNNVKYTANFKLPGMEFDYDIVIEQEDRLIVLEVKNHRHLSKSKLHSITKWLAKSCLTLHIHQNEYYPNLSNQFIEGYVVSINDNFEKDNYAKKVLSFEEFKTLKFLEL